VADQHNGEEFHWDDEELASFRKPKRDRLLNVVYDESITRRPGFSEHAARGIDGAGADQSQMRKRGRKKLFRRVLGGVAALLIFLSSMYCFLVYSSIPFIEKWRTIYIETAMGTMTHQWLATAFLPQNVIDSVMENRTSVEEQQKGLSSSWGDLSLENAVDYTQSMRPWNELEPEFSTYYSEINVSTLQAYLAEHEEDAIDENGYLFIDEADYGDEDTGIRTVSGDAVCVIDTRNGIVIVTLEDNENSYYGKMAIVKNPAQASVAAASNLEYGEGEYLEDIVQSNNAILGVNASGFYDPDGTGNGGDIYGMVFSGGERIVGRNGCLMKVISLSEDNLLNISDKKPSDAREAMQFDPVLILNGDLLISGSSGWGLQPRTVIGQTQDGQLLLAVVDGRQAGYSLGITIGDLADILYRYGAYQACNMDGGSSSLMYYDGRPITNSSAADSTYGRHIPDAWIIARGAGDFSDTIDEEGLDWEYDW
jgi:exopolysaccharide biosynthesis protein